MEHCILINRYREKDLEQILSLFKEDVPKGIANNQDCIGPLLATMSQKYLENKKYTGFVADINNQIVGYIFGCPTNRIPPLNIENPPSQNGFYGERLFVSGAFRGQGVGRQLMATLIDYARQGGYSMFWAGITIDNSPAISISEILGLQKEMSGGRYIFFKVF